MFKELLITTIICVLFFILLGLNYSHWETYGLYENTNMTWQELENKCIDDCEKYKHHQLHSDCNYVECECWNTLKTISWDDCWSSIY